nr:MAG TPA: hypothetical protein [Caudoviricetes sp.]
MTSLYFYAIILISKGLDVSTQISTLLCRKQIVRRCKGNGK